MILHDQDSRVGHDPSALGRSIQNRLPFPGSLSTPRDPFMRSTALREIARPMPVPSWGPAGFRRSKIRKSFGRFALPLSSRKPRGLPRAPQDCGLNGAPGLDERKTKSRGECPGFCRSRQRGRLTTSRTENLKSVSCRHRRPIPIRSRRRNRRSRGTGLPLRFPRPRRNDEAGPD